MIVYKINDLELAADIFLQFVQQVWPGNYDLQKTQQALHRTSNITAYDNDKLIGCLRILSDGYFLVPSLNCWFSPIIKGRVSEAISSSWQRNIPQLCCILEHNQGSKSFMKKMVAAKAYNPMKLPKATMTDRFAKIKNKIKTKN